MLELLRCVGDQRATETAHRAWLLTYRNRADAIAAGLDVQVMAGTGVSGQVLGVDLTPAISTVTVSTADLATFYKALALAISTVNTTRFLPPDVIVMHLTHDGGSGSPVCWTPRADRWSCPTSSTQATPPASSTTCPASRSSAT